MVGSFRSTFLKQKKDAKGTVEAHVFSGELVRMPSRSHLDPHGESLLLNFSWSRKTSPLTTSLLHLRKSPGPQPWHSLPLAKGFPVLLRSGVSPHGNYGAAFSAMDTSGIVSLRRLPWEQGSKWCPYRWKRWSLNKKLGRIWPTKLFCHELLVPGHQNPEQRPVRPIFIFSSIPF